MKNFKKAFLMVLCVVAIAGASIFGTLAYFTSTTETVTNTFTVGNVKITLDEEDVNEYGVDEDGTLGTRVQANEYKLIPGHTYVKDPTVHVAAGSEECYVFVKVANGISGIEAATGTIKSQIEANWTVVDETKGIYRYNTTVDATEATNPIDLVVFSTFTVAGDADLTDAIADSEITIIACAIQADGLTADTAYDNLPAAFKA